MQYLYSDKIGHDYWVAKCPHCCNFFTVRADSVKTGNTKSCGCIKREIYREIGLANRKQNRYFFPAKCSYGICYYDNYDYYFIFDMDKYHIISQYHWTARKTNDRTEPMTTIAGKVVLLARLLMDTPEGLECDHINRNPNDVRMCNLRNCTREQNMFNRDIGQGAVYEKQGKYKIKFPKEDTEKMVFESEEEAYIALCALQDKYYGEYSLRKSREIAEDNKINQFADGVAIYTGVLEKISKLPKKSIYSIILESIRRDRMNGNITEENEGRLLLQLITDYQKELETNK